MKKLMLAATLLATFAAPAIADTIMIDGCEAKLVEGTNYYNFTNPRCVTGTGAYESTDADKARAIRAAEEEAEAEETTPAA